MRKKKVLIVSQKTNINLLTVIAVREGAEVITASHVQGFDVFEREIPQIIIICEYAEKEGFINSVLLYHKIKQHLRPWQTLVRIGPEEYPYADYIQRPASQGKAERFCKTVESLIAA